MTSAENFTQSAKINHCYSYHFVWAQVNACKCMTEMMVEKLVMFYMSSKILK